MLSRCVPKEMTEYTSSNRCILFQFLDLYRMVPFWLMKPECVLWYERCFAWGLYIFMVRQLMQPNAVKLWADCFLEKICVKVSFCCTLMQTDIEPTSQKIVPHDIIWIFYRIHLIDLTWPFQFIICLNASDNIIHVKLE